MDLTDWREFARAVIDVVDVGGTLHFGDRDKAMAGFAQRWLDAEAKCAAMEKVVEAARRMRLHVMKREAADALLSLDTEAYRLLCGLNGALDALTASGGSREAT